MQIVDLFSGIGGFSLAGHWLGWDTVQMVEINPFCRRVLSHYFPKANIHDDIKTFGVEILKKSRWDATRPTIVCGGFPCQPYSVAGKRRGKEDDRHLWPFMLRAIREISPRWVVGENVRGLVNWSGGLVFDEVQADLEAEGYEILPFLLPACAKDAPHRRDRIWFVAHAEGRDDKREQRKFPAENGGPKFNHLPTPRKSSYRLCETGITADTQKQRLEKRDAKQVQHGPHPAIERHGSIPQWQDFPTQSPVCNGDDGLSTYLDTTTISFSKWRNESIKAGGNAVVPQIPYEIFKAIEAYESLIKTA